MRSSANVTSLLQQWSAAPTSAFGFAVTPRTTDGWYLETTGSPTVENHPTLTVEFTTAPTTTYRFQQGVNDYVGTTMSAISQDETIRDGGTLNAAYLDGPNGTDSLDIQALLKFDGLFGSVAGQVKPGENILRAFLVMSTATTGESHTGGTYDVHAMKVPWDLTNSFGSFGGDGPTVEQGEISDAIASSRGMIHGSRTLFDVTSTVQAWQSGATNFGFNIQAGTTDGWQIMWSGANDPSVRPELVIITGVPEPGSAMILISACAGLVAWMRPRRRRA